MLAKDCKTNPDFCGYNRVMITYCDGNSFASNRDDPVPVLGLDNKSSSIYWRGKRNLDAVLDTLVQKHGLGDATACYA